MMPHNIKNNAVGPARPGGWKGFIATSQRAIIDVETFCGDLNLRVIS